MRLVLVIILTFLVSNISGQEALSAIPIKTNVIYIGIDNPVLIDIGNSLAEPRVTVDNGEISGFTRQQYVIRPNRLGYCNVTIKDGNKFIFSSVLRVKAIPEPDPYVLDSLFGGSITVELFKSVNALRLRNRNFEWNLNPTVKKFVLTRVSPQGAESINNDGENLSSLSLKLISNAQHGDIYIFDSIVFQSLARTDGSFKSLVVRIE